MNEKRFTWASRSLKLPADTGWPHPGVRERRHDRVEAERYAVVVIEPEGVAELVQPGLPRDGRALDLQVSPRAERDGRSCRPHRSVAVG